MGSHLIRRCGHTLGTVYGTRGIDYIRQRISGFNNVADDNLYLALVDFMDTGKPCPGAIVEQWLPNRRAGMILRLVVRELESWLIADRQSLSKFLGVDITQVPQHPERIDDPKKELVRLARRSRRSSVRTALVPAQNSTAQVGPLYTSEMMRYIHNDWNADEASVLAPSLARCLDRLTRLS